MRTGPFVLLAGLMLVANPLVEAPISPPPPRLLPVVALRPAVNAKLMGRLAPRLHRDEQARVADAVSSEASRAGYDPFFILAIMRVESQFRHAVSERGARGLMQIRPSTEAWVVGHEADLRGSPLGAGDAALDVRIAVRYVKRLETRFGSRELALIAYNAGPNRLARRVRAGQLPDGWRDYPRAVEREYRRLKLLPAA